MRLAALALTLLLVACGGTSPAAAPTDGPSPTLPPIRAVTVTPVPGAPLVPTATLPALPPPTLTPAPPPQPTAVPTNPPEPVVQQPTQAPQPTAAPANCSPAYPDVCIPPPPPDLDCADIPYRRFRVLAPDPHRFDGSDNDGLGCES